MIKRLFSGLARSGAVILMVICATTAHANPQLLWGDTHLHTSYSFDAFLNGNQTADPNTAYAFARGQPVIHPGTRTRAQLKTPLDFLVIADHAEFYGGIGDIYFEGVQKSDPNLLERISFWFAENQIRDAIDGGNGLEFFRQSLTRESGSNRRRKIVGGKFGGGDTAGCRPICKKRVGTDARERPAI
ncbi:MAG: DUF3604 domain-containing protein [Candidatus Azotimanducaceae bacterium]